MKILFWLAKSKLNKRGQVPLYCRITINGERAEISTNIWILEKDFYNRYKKVRKNHLHSESFNKSLLGIATKLTNIYHNAIFFDECTLTAKQVSELYKKATFERKTHIKDIITEYIDNKHSNKTSEAFKKDNRYAALMITSLVNLGYLNCNLNDYNDYIIDKLAHRIINERKYSIGYCKKSLSFFKSSLLFAYNQRYCNRSPNFNKLNFREKNQITYLSDAEITTCKISL